MGRPLQPLCPTTLWRAPERSRARWFRCRRRRGAGATSPPLAQASLVAPMAEPPPPPTLSLIHISEPTRLARI
eukprot:2858626-Alexandrium_andersonii.AAC.1